MALEGLLCDKERSKALKETIERYVVGMGMGDLKPKSYTSEKDATIGSFGSTANVGFLTQQLKTIFNVIKTEGRELVTEAVIPETRRRTLPVLGTATTQRLDLEAKRLLSDEELKAKADEWRATRFSTRERDRPTGRSTMPKIDASLVGSRVASLEADGAYWLLLDARRDRGGL